MDKVWLTWGATERGKSGEDGLMKYDEGAFDLQFHESASLAEIYARSEYFNTGRTVMVYEICGDGACECILVVGEVKRKECSDYGAFFHWLSAHKMLMMAAAVVRVQVTRCKQES